MTNQIVLVTDVVCELVPFTGTEISVDELSPGVITDPQAAERRWYECVKRHRARVHRFCGGPFGEEGIRIAFGPAVEQKLRIPLKCLEEESRRKDEAILGLEALVESLESETRELQGCVDRCCSASFWQRLKWLFTGVKPKVRL